MVFPRQLSMRDNEMTTWFEGGCRIEDEGDVKADFFMLKQMTYLEENKKKTTNQRGPFTKFGKNVLENFLPNVVNGNFNFYYYACLGISKALIKRERKSSQVFRKLNK